MGVGAGGGRVSPITPFGKVCIAPDFREVIAFIEAKNQPIRLWSSWRKDKQPMNM